MLLFTALLTVGYVFAAPIGDNGTAEILKQVNTVNDNGSYTYGYEASDGTFRIETRDPSGVVKGRYGFFDDRGVFRIVDYSTDNGGFKAQGDHLPIQPFSKVSQPSSSHTQENVILSDNRRALDTSEDEVLNETVDDRHDSRQLHEKVLPQGVEAVHVQALQSIFEEKIDDKDVVLLEKQVEKQQHLELQETPSLPPSEVTAILAS